MCTSPYKFLRNEICSRKLLNTVLRSNDIIFHWGIRILGLNELILTRKKGVLKPMDDDDFAAMFPVWDSKMKYLESIINKESSLSALTHGSNNDGKAIGKTTNE